jgi:hypothetical protein
MSLFLITMPGLCVRQRMRHPPSWILRALFEDILCVQEERVVAADNTVRYKGLTLQIPANRHRHHFVRARVRVHAYPDGKLALFYGPRCIGRYDANGQSYDKEEKTLGGKAA